ncbi:hypothetical protein T265_08486 [Opisthorchis viverrini]|uniref:Uncharacterized protein n=1 Tax=Opisthorchis viverrini TaxID=6198 RepID=A0A074ZDJ1_OPIVI|nr:hypothetical protein T265_08486 [Opisthorchis viverrini]KER23677.1 hypothetical protein T265_08486 [Opisthorchis viverrini]
MSSHFISPQLHHVFRISFHSLIFLSFEPWKCPFRTTWLADIHSTWPMICYYGITKRTTKTLQSHIGFVLASLASQFELYPRTTDEALERRAYGHSHKSLSGDDELEESAMSTNCRRNLSVTGYIEAAETH